MKARKSKRLTERKGERERRETERGEVRKCVFLKAREREIIKREIEW